MKVLDTECKITELDKNKVYYVYIDLQDIPVENWHDIARNIKCVFEQAGIQVVVGPYDLTIKENNE